MSTKSAKKSTVTSVSSSAQVTTTTTSAASQARSPLSPTRVSRLQEKAELQNLNDRLAAYIERVRHLEVENNRLSTQIQSSEETVSREVTSVKTFYEKELQDTRNLLDETAKEKAKLQIDAGRYKAELEDLKPRLNRAETLLSSAEKNAQLLETQNNELRSSVNQLKAELGRVKDELKNVSNEREKLRKKVPELQEQLEAELLARTDLENRNLTLKEQLSFKEQMCEREVSEIRSRKQVEISEIDGRLQEQYEARLQSALQDLRDHYETLMKVNREEIETLYQIKLRDSEEQSKKQLSSNSITYEELLTTRNRVATLSSRITELESVNASLQKRLADLESTLDSERAAHSSALNSAQAEINRLRSDMAAQLQEYQDLMDIRTALDMEIAAYRKLLESEETRLNLTPTSMAARSGTPSRRTPVRAAKRQRTVLEESSSVLTDFTSTSSAKGDIEVSEVDSEGKFVKLTNKGEKEAAVGGWQVLHKANDTETVFKFHRSLKIAPGATVTVWSAGSGVTHEPPANIVMKEQRWFVADTMVTVLLNASGEEMAQRECRREQLSKSVVRQRRELPGEELLHQQGDPEGKERCAIM